jgi:hypothetical protein
LQTSGRIPTFADVLVHIRVEKETVTVSDDGGVLAVRCTCGVTDCAHAIAVELGSRAAVHPFDTDNLVAAGRIIQKHALDVTVRLAQILIRLRRNPTRGREADALQKAILEGWLAERTAL